MYRNSPPAMPQRAPAMSKWMLFVAMVIGRMANSFRPYDIGMARGAISPAPALAFLPPCALADEPADDASSERGYQKRSLASDLPQTTKKKHGTHHVS